MARSQLFCVCLALCASLAVAAPLSAFWPFQNEPLGSAPFCRGSPCPDFEVLKKTSNYELRKYDPSTWAAVEAPGGYVKASTEGYAELYRYIDGANDEEKKLPASKPLVLTFQANEDYSKAVQNHTVLYYLADQEEDNAPKPTDANVKVVGGDYERAYVKGFGGFATESSILSTAKSLAEELKADGVEVQGTFYFALYDGPQYLIGRHNEIIMQAE